MITNLLDKCVNINDQIGKICAIYEKSGHVMTIIVLESGSVLADIQVTDLIVFDERSFAVALFWNYEQKIRAIKVVRQFSGTGLKEAKEHVEKHPYRVPVKDGLTFDEAKEMVRQITISDKMECEMYRM